MRGLISLKSSYRNRMKVPGYPSNREADERTKEATAKAGRRASKMKLSRETCLHREINHSPGGGICYLG